MEQDKLCRFIFDAGGEKAWRWDRFLKETIELEDSHLESWVTVPISVIFMNHHTYVTDALTSYS